MIAITHPQYAVNVFASSEPAVTNHRIARPSRWAAFLTALLRALAVAAA